MKKRLVKSISQITFVFVLFSMLIGVMPFDTRVLVAEAPANDGWNVLIDDNFDNYSMGTKAETFGYSVYKPMYEQGNAGDLQGDAYVAQAPGGTGNSLYVYDNYNSVSEVVFRNHTRIVKAFEKQEGVVVAEVSVMLPGRLRETTKVLNLLSSNGDYIARITANPGTEEFVFDAKTGPDDISPYEPNKWYNIKLVVDIVNDQVMVYVDGILCFSKQPTVEVRSAGTTTSEKIKQNIAMLEILTAGRSPNPVNALYVDNIKVSAKPPAETVEAPTGVKAYPRDGEIYVEWTPTASARFNNVYVATKPNAADSEYVKVVNNYNKRNIPNDNVSFTKIGTSPIENGKTYYVKVTQRTRLLKNGSDKEVEGSLSSSQPVAVTPVARIALDSIPSSAIDNVYVHDTKNASQWSVQSNIAEGSVPYGDTSSVITKLPSGYAGADWIRTANASNIYAANDVLTTFNLTDEADVIVAMSQNTLDANRDWLSSWTRTGEVIELDSGAVTFDVYKKNFAMNSEIALGKIGQKDSNGYFIIVKGRSILLDPLSRVVKTPSYTVSGSVYNNINMTIKLNGSVVVDSEYYAVNSRFTRDITLVPGTNTIDITGILGSGSVWTQTLTVKYEVLSVKAGFYDLNGNPMSQLTPGAETTVRVEFVNHTAENQNFVVIFALYNDKNSMVNYTSVSDAIGAGEKKMVGTGMKIPQDSDGYKVSAYIWDNIKGKKPLLSSISLQ